MKKVTMFLFALLCSASLFAHDFEVDGIYYNFLGEDSVEVTEPNSYNEYIDTVVIPAMVEYNSTTYRVTSIGEYAFMNCTGLTSVTIGESVTAIGMSAFRNTGLISVTIPNNVISIAYGAFNGCMKLNYNIYDNAKYLGNEENLYLALIEATDRSVTSCVINDQTKIIGDCAFASCYDLLSATIPNSVATIGSLAFEGCRGLISVTIGESVTTIGSSAFSRCTSLTSITIPESVTSISNSAFYGCSNLTSVTIPNSVTSIGDNIFGACSSLSTPIYNAHVFILLPTSYVGTYTIPDGITMVASYAFEDCNGLTSVTIPESVTSIGNYAFRNCTSLTSVIIPNNVASIGSYAFFGSGVTTPLYNDRIFAYLPIAYSGTYTIPNNITIIAPSAFSSCSGLTLVIIPETIISIGSAAFFGCSGLTSITIPNGVTSIGNGAFIECTGLQEIICLATMPPAIGATTFNEVSREIPVYVPAESVEAYKTAAYWSEFNVQPIGENTGIEQAEILDNIYTENGRIYGAEDMQIFTVTGIDVTKENGNLQGVYVVKSGNKVGKIIVK